MGSTPEREEAVFRDADAVELTEDQLDAGVAVLREWVASDDPNGYKVVRRIYEAIQTARPRAHCGPTIK